MPKGVIMSDRYESTHSVNHESTETTTILDSGGERHQFASGSVRDIQEGKGRCDLLPLWEVADIFNINYMYLLAAFVECGTIVDLKRAIREFSIRHFGDFQTAILEVSIHFEEGCKKYGEDNWRKGIPTSSYLNSAVRHALKHERGDKDERHDRAFLWNLLCMWWTIRNKPDLNDLQYAKEAMNDLD